MARNYYCQVSSLKEYTLEGDSRGLNPAALRDEIMAELEGSDAEAFRLLTGFYDIVNITAVIERGESAYAHCSKLGNISTERLGAIAAAVKSNIEHKDSDEEYPTPAYIINVMDAFREPIEAPDRGIDTELGFSRSLWKAFYEVALSHENHFLKEWFTFDCDLRNVSAAYTARALGRDIASQVVGDGEIAEALRSSAAADFGIKGELEYIDELIQILGLDDMLAKERKLDMLRWSKIDDLVTFNYFDLDYLLGYMSKIAIIDRWLVLDKKTGEEMFSKLINELSSADKLE